MLTPTGEILHSFIIAENVYELSETSLTSRLFKTTQVIDKIFDGFPSSSLISTHQIFVSDPMKLLPILKSKGDPTLSGYMQLTAAYDGILETTAACYVSESSSRGWAEFTIKESIVSKVSIAANISENL